tara:strand:- start:1312 stop:2262 length:951 start_codon:yes stop_codon:yes gene_type:complete
MKNIFYISIYIYLVVLALKILDYITNIRSVNFKLFYYYFFKKKNKIINDKYYDIVSTTNCKLSFLDKLKLYYLSNVFKSFSNFTELMHINYILNSNLYPDMKMKSKFYWYLFCKKYKLNHPKVYIVKQDNKIFNYSKVKYNRMYISKPLSCDQGFSIKKISGNQVSSFLEKNDNVLIQEVLKDNFIDNLGRHFRFISSFDGNVLGLYEWINKKNFIGHGRFGGISKNITEKYLTNSLNFSSLENYLLREMIEKILKIHKNDYKKLISIGWDLMFHNKNIYILEGNVSHGVLPPSSTQNDVDRYYNKLDEFLKLNKL